ncbi:hypothetical protein QBZ16_001610 [Prototheca wickerhamii]|uniref:Uncharacterized protein n=1 Tax=Prototheca wickerhamii TaxID=3111 RepID=A0AAD9IEA5_PROWI|nr:hypothetical protein QBZ16_001610 [Prototheca wickerhamii]
MLLATGLEAVWGTSLLLPYPLHRPAVALARSTYTPYGKTFVHTVTGFLLLAMAGPMWDAYRLAKHAEGPLGVSETTSTAVRASDQEAKMQLSSALMLLLLGGLFVLRKLGRVMGDLYESDRNLEAVTDEMGQAVSEPSTPPKEGKVADPVAVQDEPLSGEESGQGPAARQMEATDHVLAQIAGAEEAGATVQM